MIDFQTIAQCAPNVHPIVMQRIMTIETRHNPHAIGFRIVKNKQDYRLPYQPKTLAQAKYIANWLYSNGYKYDLGIAQINSGNFARFKVTPNDMFDTCKNLYVSSQILSEFYVNAQKHMPNNQQALQAAISAYNSGKYNSTAGQKYFNKVRSIRIEYAKLPI
jgi:type IV secretion system protein VirB1